MKKETSKLPADIKESDTKYPDYKANSKPWRIGENADLPYTLTFYNVKGRGWVLCTLHISNPSSRQKQGTAARTYSIGVDDSKVYTVGRGPHVLQEITVYLTEDNIDRLRKYVELYNKGMEDASMIRDRISSRRAQGTLRRGNRPWDMF